MTTTLPIRTFHALDDGQSVVSCPPQTFRRGIAQLHKAGFQTSGLSDAIVDLRTGIISPPRTFVITFDDGFQSVYDAAFPILRDYGMTATVFLTVGNNARRAGAQRLPPLSGRLMLTWDEIREMCRHGIAFGAHTLTHPDLRQLSDAQIEAEMLGSKEVIEQELGTRIECFAYPFGSYDSRSYAIAREAFALACSDRLGLVRSDSDPYALERVDTFYLRSEVGFVLMRTNWFPYYVSACSTPRRMRRAFRRGLRR